MFVKICGTTNLHDARLSTELGADALGFIFAPSKRQVSVEQAAAITHELPASVLRVGVFTDPDPAKIRDVVQAAGLDAVQMHWRYSRHATASLRKQLDAKVQLWQVVGFPVDPYESGQVEAAFVELLRESLSDSAVDAVLLDAVKGKHSGGLGQRFSWSRAAALVHSEREIRRRMAGHEQELPRLLVAGGLDADNVREAAATLLPDGVDVVSGVEAGPGKKSPVRLRAFLEAAKGEEFAGT